VRGAHVRINAEVWDGHKQGRREEGEILAAGVGRGGAERVVDLGVLPAKAAEGESVLLVATSKPGAREGAASFALVSEDAAGDAGIELVLGGGRPAAHY
jgi:hypothetical protein